MSSASQRAKTHRTCATCKRTLPVQRMEKGRARCRNRKDCAGATLAWLAAENFVVGGA